MRLRTRIVASAAALLALVAFVSALVAVWSPSDSHARSGWGGQAVICGLAAFVVGIAAAGLAEGDS